MKKDKNKVKILLRESGIEEKELDIAVEKIFDFANLLFDKWLFQQKKIYEKRKV